MDEQGIRYTIEILGSKYVIEQTEQGDFELLIAEKSKGRFSSANQARESIIAVIKEQTEAEEAVVRNQVPLLGNWGRERTFPFDADER